MTSTDHIITWYESAASEWISLVAHVAGADGVMVGDPAVGVVSAEAGAGIPALLLDAILTRADRTPSADARTT